MKVFDVAVIGSGPAGLMSAIFASKKNKSVIILEKNEKIGRKILATGNGRCNITNKDININRYHSGDKKFISSVLNSFDQHQTMRFFESMDVVLKEEDNGRIFPKTNKAQTIVDALAHELGHGDVKINTNSTVKSIEHKDNWHITLSNNQIVNAKKIILATGGKVAEQFGSSGDGLYWAEKLGHTLTPIHPALCPININESFVKNIQGLKVEAKLTATSEGEKISSSEGDTLFTHFGISGPAPMALSRSISPALENNSVIISIDLFSDTDEQKLDIKLEKIFRNSGKKTVKNALNGVIAANMIPIILELSNCDKNEKAAEISKKTRKIIIENLKCLKLSVKSIRSLKEAQITSGGVDLSEINPKTLESNIVKNLYFAGEIMDVDGDSGGFNLQWAWSSGYIAGTNI